MPEEANWIWRLYINGEPVDMTDIRHIAVMSRFGVVNFGADERAGYNSIAFQEVGQGGAIVVPFVCLDGQQVVRPDQPYSRLLVGVVEQYRNKQGGMVLNVPRGFIKPEEGHDAAAARELAEETGLQGRPFLLPGSPLNPNSAFFETGAEGGCRVYGFCLGPDQVEVDEAGVHLVAERLSDSAQEIIGKCQFISAAKVSQLGDMFSVAGVARLWYFLGIGK